MTHKSLVGMLLLAGVALSGVYALSTPQAPPAPDVFPSELLDFSPLDFRPAALSTHLRQSFSYDSGGEAVVVRWGESDPTAPGTWYESEVVEAVSFQTTAVASTAGGSVLFVAGIRDDGVSLVERWAYSPRSGGYGIQVTSGTPQSIGTPMPPYSAQEVLNGTAFSKPNPQHAHARRSVVFRGTSVGHIRSLAADPEGRFLLVLSYPTGTIYQISLLGNSPPTAVFTPSGVPHLAEARTIEILHDVANGRSCLLTELKGCVYPPNHRRTLLRDPNNDGIFDVAVTLTGAEWVAAGLDEDSAWQTYQNVGVVFNW